MRSLSGFCAFVWVAAALSYGTVGSAAGVEQTVGVAAVAPAAPAPAPAQPCPGCDDFALDLPAEPSEDSFGTQDNTTVEVEVTFPSGWSQLTCADKYDVVARRALAQDVPVTGWRCLMPSPNTLRFTGPGIADVEDSAQRFLFRGRAPSPINDNAPGFSAVLTAGFVEILQTFRDGEQQRHRGMKQLQARLDQPTPATLVVNDEFLWVDLPPDWTGACATLGDEPKVGLGVAQILAGEWDCDAIPGVGDHPRFRVQWKPEDTTPGQARFFDFDAVTKLDQPTLAPLTAGRPTAVNPVDRLRDLMFVDGEIRTARIAYVKRGTVTAPPTSTPAPAASASATPRITPSYQPLCPTATPGFNTVPPVTGTLPQPYPLGYSQPIAPGYPEGPFVYPYNPVQPPGQVPFPGYPYAVGPGIDGLAHDPCAPPTVVLDPCAGEVFTKNGSRRFLPEDRELPDGCAYPFERREGAIGNYRGESCLINKPSPSAGHPPGHGRDGSGAGYDRGPHRADRSHHRLPLLPAPIDPTPPVVVVPPGDRTSTARVPGAPDERILLTSPNPSPAPTLQALIPDEPLPYCEDLALLPHAGGNSFGLLRLALATVGLGAALLAGAVFWRRHAPRGMRYSRA
ncbi:MAG: hypothetical protein ACT4QF_14545 [Sporichthyaceae bacterium]